MNGGLIREILRDFKYSFYGRTIMIFLGDAKKVVGTKIHLYFRFTERVYFRLVISLCLPCK